MTTTHKEDILFTSNINKIKEFIDIPSGSEVEKEISHMTGLVESLYNEAYKRLAKNYMTKYMKKLWK